MRPAFIDTLARIVAMVLAGMVSLSILGAIAAMSEGRLGPSSFPLDPRPTEMPDEKEAAQPRPQGGEGVRRGEGSAGDSAVSIPAQAAPVSAEAAAAEAAAKWLEVIAYVLFALAFLAALIGLALWRIAAALRRSAEAAEALAARPPPR
jgi:hypothetical protein